MKKTLLNLLKDKKTVQLTIISVSTKGEKQAGTIQLCKYVAYKRCAQSPHKLYPNVEMIKTKCPND